jgi:hypothetical protein
MDVSHNKTSNLIKQCIAKARVQPNTTPNSTYNPSFSSEDTNDNDDDDSLLDYQESSGNIFSFDNISHMSDNDDHSSTASETTA